jgi:MraZ protein
MKPGFRKSVHRSLDSKGRLMLPPEYRDIICAASSSGSFVLSGYDEFIVAYTVSEWEAFEEKISQLQSPSRYLSNFRRQMRGRAEELELDPQGRVRISQALMRFAGLHKDVLLVGQGSTFEIWDTQRFDGLRLDGAALDFVAKELAQSGIDFSL